MKPVTQVMPYRYSNGVWERVRGRVLERVRGRVWERVAERVWERVGERVGERVWDIRDSLKKLFL